MKARVKADRRVDDSQHASLLDEMTGVLERVLAAMPALQKQADDMGRGYPSRGTDPGGSAGGSSPVERLALNPSHDPALVASRTLAELDRLLVAWRRLDRAVRGALPVVVVEERVEVRVRAPRCESCSAEGAAGSFKMGRWCEACYRRLLRRRSGESS